MASSNCPLRLSYLVTATCLIAVGCSGPPILSLVVPTSGVVTARKGVPLKSVRLVFTPARLDTSKPPPTPMLPAYADVDEVGKFAITTATDGDGIAPGHYVVSVEPYNYRHSSGKPQKVLCLVDRKYLNADRSDLLLEVKGGEYLLVQFK